MNKIVIDFETYFSKDYSLKKMNQLLYVRDPRFKIFGAGISTNGCAPEWITGMEMLHSHILDIRPVTIIGHNLHFDGLILTERLGIPRDGVTWRDTLSMARAVINAASHSLAALSKGSHAVKLSMPDVAGKTELSPAEEAALAEYCLADVNATQALYNRLIEGYPESELELIDLVIEMGVRAKLELNKEMLELAMEEAKTERAERIKAAGIDEKILASNQQFAKHLVAIGATPPTKISITTGRETTAFSKADVEYVRFQDEHPELRTLFKAREAVKSTLPITRTQAFIDIANSGNLAVPLNYGSTITGRLSGGSGINLQNMPRNSALRKSITSNSRPLEKIILINVL